ncbi:M57 family metalloprotease [Cohnella sp. AR92]|uniref:M57 family metalloprotease n=1 Tax=Cohnella sp. AR92 TaxID=648716 RepID=UPI0013155E3B|nr:M57 family metalloprotease [Cohnella sp. AR92]
MKKGFILCSVLTLALVVPLSNASAYNLLTTKWPKTVGSTYVVKVKYSTIISTDAKNAFDTAVSDWNSAQTKISFNLSTSNSTSSNVVTTENVADQSLFGDTLLTSSGTTISYFTAMINVGNSDVINKSNTRRSAAGHELGHALGLDHPPAPTLSIMNSFRDREVVYTPQLDDKDGIKAQYPL